MPNGDTVAREFRRPRPHAATILKVKVWWQFEGREVPRIQTAMRNLPLPPKRASISSFAPVAPAQKSGNGHPSAAGLIEAVTHKTAWTVNHAEEVKMAQGLTTEVK